MAESLTGGLVASRIVAVPGVSAWFRGGIVAYDSAVKIDLLDVPEGPVVSEAAAKAMADGVRRRLGADIGISTTGVAGPTAQDGEPPGTVWLGMAMGDEVTAVRVQLPGDRDAGPPDERDLAPRPPPPPALVADRSPLREGP